MEATKASVASVVALGALVLVVCIVLLTEARDDDRQWLERHPRVIPLTVENGIYMCTLVFDGAEADVVVDSGSTHLLLAGRSCGRLCDDATSLRVRDAETVTLAYGSQQSEVVWRVGTLRLGRRSIPGVRAALTKRIDGETRYNILGLARGPLQRAVAPRRFAVALMQDRGLLAIDERAIRAMRRRWYAQRPTRIPLRRDRLPLYAVRGVLRSADGAAAFSGDVIVDIGSNFLSMPRRTLDRLGETFRADAPMSLELGGGARVLEFGPNIYRFAGGSLLVDAHDDVEDDDMLVLGSFFMRGLALEFGATHLDVAPLKT